MFRVRHSIKIEKVVAHNHVGRRTRRHETLATGTTHQVGTDKEEGTQFATLCGDQRCAPSHGQGLLDETLGEVGGIYCPHKYASTQRSLPHVRQYPNALS